MLDLNQFIGTTQYHRLTLYTKVLFTDGMAYVHEHAPAAWLSDLIADFLLSSKAAYQEFITLDMLVNSNQEAILTFTDGNKHKLKVYHLQYTDFPLAAFKAFAQFNGSQWIVMLPSEH